ncbi:MAG: DNA-binding response regulator [Snowella sp.]|jgi:DNA-binding NarL/FixJ family response regulator|nr:MAG: DNA-binding response regulator [Snowella sp.]
MTKIRVVLIEDDDLVCIGLKNALENLPDIDWLGEANTGEEGFQLLETTQPDVAIMDIGLPDVDGIELTKRIKASPTLQRTKILILTLQNEETSVLEAFQAGANSYCMKNIRPDLLLEAIRATQAGQAWIDPAIARIVLAYAKRVEKPDSQHQTEKVSSSLTDRELEVLQLIVNGNSNADIAEKLYITVGTVKTHVRNILTKLSAEDRTQAAVHALRSGLVG